MRALILTCTVLFFTVGHISTVLATTVPVKMEFAGMKLHLNAAARSQIEKDVDRLKRSNTYFQSLIKKVDIYFPIIEQVFREEGFPDEIKYLAIQESALKPDAVSSSNAVGYWQFKAGSATEVGLRVDNVIDERKNIAAASRGAAEYMSRNYNKYKLKNWVNAVIAYNTGPGGVQKYAKDKDVDAKSMDITGNTHWYFLKLLAHIIAFQDEVGKSTPEILLQVMPSSGDKSVKNIYKEYNLDYDVMEEYNRWISGSKHIPHDKAYPVIIATLAYGPLLVIEQGNSKTNGGKPALKLPEIDEPEKTKPAQMPDYAINNRLSAIRAKPGDNLRSLAEQGEVKFKKFLRYNEVKKYDGVEPGQLYYLKNKRSKALVDYDTIREGETLWSISQKHGIRQYNILNNNRMHESEIKPGRVLWLRKVRPKEEPVVIIPSSKVVKPTPQPETEIKIPEVKPATEVEDKELDMKEEERDDVEMEDLPDEAEGEFIQHTVAPKETLYSISRKYSVSVEDILRWNNKENYQLSVGEVLQIKQ